MCRLIQAMTMLVVFLLVSPVCIWAQVYQKGIVLLQNSGKQPLTQVTVLVSGAVPTTSDSQGEFTLHFSTRKEGEAVRTLDVSKTGYELVNSKEISLWNISSSRPFTIVMCPKGALAESRRRYYRLGEDRYRVLYQKKLKELEAAVESNAQMEAEYHRKLEEANRQLQQAMERLGEFCDRFARINRDMLGELDQRALELLDKGDVEGAIQVYEDAQLLQNFRDKTQLRNSLRKERNFVREKIEEEIGLLEKEGSPSSLQRRDSLRNVLEQY